MHHALIGLLIAIAGPSLDFREWIRYDGAVYMPQAVALIDESSKTARDSTKGLVVMISDSDSQGGVSTARRLPQFDELTSLAGGICALRLNTGETTKSWADHGTHVAIVGSTFTSAGNWTIQTGDYGNSLAIGDAWDSNSNTSCHMFHSIGFTATGSSLNGVALFACGLDIAELGLTDESRITAKVFYRKCNANDIAIRVSQFKIATGDTWPTDGTPGGSASDQTFTYEKYSSAPASEAVGEIGVMDIVLSGASFWADNSTVDIRGFRFETESSASGAVSGNHIEILGVWWYYSRSSNSKEVLATGLSGLIDIAFKRDGYDASEMLDNVDPAVRTKVLSELSIIRGNGTLNSTTPVDVYSQVMGHNRDTTRGYIDGTEALRAHWETRLDGGGFDHPTWEFVPTWAAEQITNGRMREQSLEMYLYCLNNGYNLVDLYQTFRGFSPGDPTLLSLQDPWGQDYDDIDMDGAGQGYHPANNAAAVSIWGKYWYALNKALDTVYIGGVSRDNPSRSRMRPDP